MQIKKGDTVKIISGKDRGKQGKITQVFPQENKVVVDGINTNKKHLPARKQSESGQIIEFFAPLPVSKVQLICPKCGRITRLGYDLTKDGKKVRICKKCKSSL
jgi:large subunit ribosomal protein L24